MWTRRLTLGIALLPTALMLVACDAQQEGAPTPRDREPRMHTGAPQPTIIRRPTWHADEKSVKEKPEYSASVTMVFLHHTNHSDDYDCERDAPEMLRSMEEHHIRDMGWNDLGYNFVVDRCGNIYEGRAGGLGRPVRGAHTKGFNQQSVGIAALGRFEEAEPPPPMLRAIAAVAAWKLSPGVDPMGKVRMASTSGESRYPKGKPVDLDVISGHRDGYETSCPGDALYHALPWLREAVARLRAPSPPHR